MKLLKLKLANVANLPLGRINILRFFFLLYSKFPFLLLLSSSSIDLSLDYTTPVALVFEPLPLRGTTDQRFETYEYGT